MLLDLLPLFAGSEPEPPSRAGGGWAAAPVYRKVIRSGGELIVTVLLHGDPGPLPAMGGEGRARSGSALSASAAGTSRITATQAMHANAASAARPRTRGALTATTTTTATRSRIHDPAELWLILDLPELA